jgi:dihydroflavonol-4-reductase
MSRERSSAGGARVLVTGASGFVGSAVVRALSQSGWAVRCLLRETSDTRRIDGLGWERALGDVREPDAVLAAVQGCDAIIHLAGVSSWSEHRSPVLEEVNEHGTRHVLEAAERCGVARVVFVSSIVTLSGTLRPEVTDESYQPDLLDEGLRYARVKRRCEALCLEACQRGTEVVIVNPGEVYGPDDSELVTAGNLIGFLTSKPVLVCRGGTSVVHVDDVATAIVLALERGLPGQRYILSGDNLTVEELARLCLDTAGRRAPVLVSPNWMMRGLASLGARLGLPLPFEPAVVPYATRYWFTTSGKATRELGARFRPAPQVLAPTIRWLADSGWIA